MKNPFFWLASVLLFSCTEAEEEKNSTLDDPADAACSADDSDGDGLSGCDEEELGTDPEMPDSDGDGLTDGEEQACVSDPMDASEVCYACGWAHNDPGDLESTGSAEGDVIANAALLDQCGDTVQLWDFYGEYHLLYLTSST